MKKILIEKEILFSEIISKGYGNRDFYNLLEFWKKIRVNSSKFSINQKLTNLIKEIDKKIESIESKIHLIEEEKIKNKSTKPENIVYNRVVVKKNNNKKEITNEKMSKQTLLKEKNKIDTIPVNNIENNSFIFCKEQLDKNIYEITKNDKKLISFIDIDLLLQRIAQGINIYDDPIMENGLLEGFCVQHTAFIYTDILISKIISCFNYFYYEYINEDIENNKNNKNKANVGLRRKDGPNQIYKDDLNKNNFNEHFKKIPYNIINLLIRFVDLHNKYCKETLNSEIIKKIESFYKSILEINEIKNKYGKEINSSLDILKEIYNSYILKRTPSLHNKIPYESLFPHQITLKDIIANPDYPTSFFNILDFDSKEIALELTNISYKLFSKIKIKEFLKGVFTKKNKNITSPNITEISNRFNKVSFWTIEEILMYDDAFDRGKLIEKFIDIINELIILNNFFDSISISSGLSQIIISNLTKTWNYVSRQSMEMYQKAKNFLSFQNNYKTIRDKIDQCIINNQPYIPFLGPYSKTICYLEEYGPYIKDNSLVNADKIVLVQQVFDQLFKFRLNKYNKFNMIRNELLILYCLDPAPEEELDKLASFLEPNFVLYEKKQSDKRASNTEKNFKKNYEANTDLI